MNRFNLLLLVLVVGVLGVAWWVTSRSVPPATTTPTTGNAGAAALLPGLAEQVASIDRVRIERGEQSAVYVKRGVDWFEQISGYPVNAEPVRALLVTLARFKADAPRTSNPENFASLELNWPDEQNNTRRVTLSSLEKPDLSFDVLLGRETYSPDHTYARLFDQGQTYRLEGHASTDADATRWMARDAVAVPASGVISIHLQGLTLHKQADGTWQPDHLDAAATQRWPDAKLAQAQGTLPELLSTAKFDSVEPADEATQPTARIDYALIDGSSVTAHLTNRDGQWWVRLTTQLPATQHAATQPEEADADPQVTVTPDQQRARSGQWVYRLPTWQNDRLTQLMQPPQEEVSQPQP
jgi:hypothetical protein